MNRRLRLILADDHPILRDGLRLLLAAHPDLEVVGDAADGEAAVALAERLQPDVAVMDINMPRLNGIEAARRIRAARPETSVIILTMHDDEALFFDALRAGASGYVLKGANSSDLIEAIHAAAAGEIHLAPAMARKLVGGFLRRDDPAAPDDRDSRLAGLTPRERDILRLLADGLTNREIAEALVISPSTVQTHRTHIMEKLGLRNRADLVRYALRVGLIHEA